MGKRIMIFLALLCLCFPAYGEDTGYCRIVSRDASVEAQREKYRVLGAVLPLLIRDSRPVSDRLTEIEAAADRIAPCDVDIRIWAPPGKAEGKTLYITIGEGMGPNWWGILYDGGLGLFARDTGEEGVSFTWPVIDWLLNLLGRNRE